MRNKLLAASGKVLISSIAVVFSGVVLVSSATAQGVSSVVESQFTPGQSRSGASAPYSAPQSNDALSLLLDQNRDLQTEVQALRALVEEQNFELRKLQRDSLSRYTNVDDRLSSLEATAVAPGVSNPLGADTSGANSVADNSANAGNAAATAADSGNAGGSFLVSARRSSPGTANAAVSSPGRATLQPAILSEQQLYQMAYDSVINSNFKRSIAEFDQYLSVYTQGRFVDNAHYWKGQAYLYLERFAEARGSYEIILNLEPPSAKLPDAMYGLALAYQGQGDITQTRQLLNDIRRRFPNTGAALLADTRLLSLD